jgi:hypothetical protein
VLQLSGAKKAAVPAFMTFALAFFCARLIGFPYLVMWPTVQYLHLSGPIGFSNPHRTVQVLLPPPTIHFKQPRAALRFAATVDVHASAFCDGVRFSVL